MLVGKTQAQSFPREGQGAQASLAYMMLQLVPEQLKIHPCLDSGVDLVVVKEGRGVQG